MNRGTDLTTPTAPVFHSARAEQHGHRTGRRRALIALATASLSVGSFSLAAHATADEEIDERCTPTGQGSADSLERRALACQAVLDGAYVACMRNAAGTPDSAERWVDYCQTQALG